MKISGVSVIETGQGFHILWHWRTWFILQLIPLLLFRLKIDVCLDAFVTSTDYNQICSEIYVSILSILGCALMILLKMTSLFIWLEYDEVQQCLIHDCFLSPEKEFAFTVWKRLSMHKIFARRQVVCQKSNCYSTNLFRYSRTTEMGMRANEAKGNDAQVYYCDKFKYNAYNVPFNESIWLLYIYYRVYSH